MIGRLTYTAICALLLSDSASACRCAPLTLAEYYAAASVVFFARLEGHVPTADGTEQSLGLVSVGAPFKGALVDLKIRTAASSAACGITLATGTQYLFFVHTDAQASGIGRVNTCDGTRPFDARSELGRSGFEDTPARFVVARLTALQAAAGFGGDPAPGPRRLLGLLDLSALAHGGSIALRATPSADAPVLRYLCGTEGLPTLEASYEFPAAIVVDQRPGWYAIRTDGNNPAALGWLQAGEAGTFWPYVDLVKNRLSYLRRSWDGFLWPDAPGAGRPVRLEQRARETSIDVLGVRNLAGTMWLDVQILDPGPCAGPESRATLRGWVPAYSKTGETTAWFYSRGC